MAEINIFMLPLSLKALGLPLLPHTQFSSAVVLWDVEFS